MQVTADYGLPGGTVSVGDGESSCQLTLVNQAGSCALTATYRGNRSINAHYTPDNGVHAASDAPVASIEVQGIAVSLTLDLPVGPNTVGDSIVLTPEIVDVLLGIDPTPMPLGTPHLVSLANLLAVL